MCKFIIILHQYSDNKLKPVYETIAASNYRLGSKRGTKREDHARLGGLGTKWKSVFYGKLTRTTTPKILSVSPLTTKEHRIFDFFINNVKTALQVFFHFVMMFFGSIYIDYYMLRA